MIKKEKELNNISSIYGMSINSGKFINRVNLPFWDDIYSKTIEAKKKNVWISLIYGKNSSGKSTVSRDFYNINQINSSTNSYFTDYNGKKVKWNCFKKIFVFNEEYIEKNVKFVEKGLSNILLGEKQITLENYSNQTKSILEELDIFFNKKEPNALPYLINTILKKLNDSSKTSNSRFTRLKELESITKKDILKFEKKANLKTIKSICEFKTKNKKPLEISSYKEWYEKLSLLQQKINQDSSFSSVTKVKKELKDLELLNQKISYFQIKSNCNYLNYQIDETIDIYVDIIRFIDQYFVILEETKNFYKDFYMYHLGLLKKLVNKINEVLSVGYAKEYNLVFLKNEYQVLKSFLSDTLKKINDKSKTSKKNLQNIVNNPHEIINKKLKFIFWDSKDVKISMDENGKYNLTINKNKIEPHELSTGEKNIIALCYFFTSFIVEVENKDELMIVIDDPVSSFDVDNQLSVLRYLKSEIDLINESYKTYKQYGKEMKVWKNAELKIKILIMTHDLTVYRDLITQFTNTPELQNRFVFFELKDEKLKKRDRFTHEYSDLLNSIYDYAILNENSNNSIGNTLRKVLEAFLMFESKMSISNITQDNVLKKLLSDNYAEYFQGLMLTISLNKESHYGDNIKDFVSTYFQFEDNLSVMKRVAQSVLCFIHLINHKHIGMHINDDAVKNVEKWINKIDESNFLFKEPKKY